MMDAQRALIRDMLSGRVCSDCGDPIEPGEDCETCAAKAVLVDFILDRQEPDA